MTTFGSNMEVNGTITARQATQAGQAVVLGNDSTIPTNFYKSAQSAQISDGSADF